MGEHSCEGWSCHLIYILESLYSNLYKFFYSPCPPVSDGESLVFKALTVVSLVASQSLLPPRLQWCLLYILTRARDFAQQKKKKTSLEVLLWKLLRASDQRWGYQRHRYNFLLSLMGLVSHFPHSGLLKWECCSGAVLSVLGRCCWEEGTVSPTQALALSHIMLTKLRCFWI